MLKMLEQTDLPVIASSMRRQILESLSEPDSAASLARRLGMSRQRVGYHMRELEKAGFLELVQKRQQRGCTERLYRARQVTYVMEPEGPEEMSSGKLQDRFSWAGLVQLAARVLKELTMLRKRADREDKKLPTLSLEASIAFANPADRKAFTKEITESIQQIVKKYHAADAEGSRHYQFFAGAYPYVAPAKDKKTLQ